MCVKMKLEEIFKESNNLDSTEKYEKSGVFIFEDSNDFLKAIEELQNIYLSSTSEGVESNE